MNQKPGTKHQRHLTDVVKVLGARSYLLVAGTALTIVLARWLGAEDFGRYQLVLAAVALIPIVLDFGISHSLPRFLAEYRDRRPDQMVHALSKGLQLKLVALILGAVVIILLRHQIEAWFHLESVHPWLGAGLLILLGLSVMEFQLKVFEGTQHFGGTVVVNVFKSTADLVLSVALVAAGYALGGALYGKVAGTFLGILAGGWWMWSRVTRNLPPPGPAEPGLARAILGYGSWLIIIDVAGRVALNLDRLLINGLLSAEAVGLYSVPARILLMSQILGLSVSNVVGPAAGRSDRPGEILIPAFRFLAGVYVLAAVLVGFWADRVIPFVFGATYIESVPTLRVLVWAMPLMGLSPVISLVLNYTGAARQRAWMIVIALAVGISANLIFIPRWGIIGSGAALLLGQLVYVTLQGLYLARHLRLSLPRLFKAYLKIGGLGMLAAAALFAVHGRGLIPEIAVTIIAGAGYVWGAVRLGIVSPGYITRLRRRNTE